MSDPTANCTSVSPQCPVDQTIYGYTPNLGANAFCKYLFFLTLPMFYELNGIVHYSPVLFLSFVSTNVVLIDYSLRLFRPLPRRQCPPTIQIQNMDIRQCGLSRRFSRTYRLRRSDHNAQQPMEQHGLRDANLLSYSRTLILCCCPLPYIKRHGSSYRPSIFPDSSSSLPVDIHQL